MLMEHASTLMIIDLPFCLPSRMASADGLGASVMVSTWWTNARRGGLREKAFHDDAHVDPLRHDNASLSVSYNRAGVRFVCSLYMRRKRDQHGEHV